MGPTAKQRQPLRWIVWHPHQMLWNWRLVGGINRVLGDRALGRWAVSALVGVDSVVLTGRAYARSLRRGRPSGEKSTVRDRQRVLYIDCGLHKCGEQVRFMHRWFSDRYELEIIGFEAGGDHFADAVDSLSDLDGVQLHHLALVGPDCTESEVRLYKSGGGGKGDSLFSERGESYDLVPAMRLSEFLVREGHDLEKVPVILRMNIEGAEQFVIDDLIAAGLDGFVDGYFGMWDDLSKINPDEDRRFRRLLRTHRISKLSFNDRDLPFRLRSHAIRTDVTTSIRAGQARVSRSDPVLSRGT